MMPGSAPDSVIERVVEILRSKTCWCQRTKYANHAICTHCWAKLTKEQRDALYLKGPEFLTAYEAATAFLAKHVRPHKAVPAKTKARLFDGGYPD
jgi:hypothetical protein